MDDKELVKQVTEQGNTQAFSQIVSRYGGLVYSKALGVVHRDELAREVAQMAFVKAFDRLSYWRGPQLGPWLVTIALHTALSLLDKERRRRTLPLESAPAPVSEDYSPEREQLLQRMEAALQQLPEADQQLVRLHYYEHLKTNDIAHRTGLTQQNVLVRLHRIRERLKTLMQHETAE